MPTIMTHPAPILALAIGLGSSRISPRLAVAAAICTIIPDLDVIGFRFGIAYSDILGHRGLSHSFTFAIFTGIAGAAAAPLLQCKRWTAFFLLSFAIASHILLDAATSGGLGTAFFWPFSEERYFLPWRPIRVSPFNPGIFLTQRGITVLWSEFLWVWCPCSAVAFCLRLICSKSRYSSSFYKS